MEKLDEKDPFMGTAPPVETEQLTMRDIQEAVNVLDRNHALPDDLTLKWKGGEISTSTRGKTVDEVVAEVCRKLNDGDFSKKHREMLAGELRRAVWVKDRNRQFFEAHPELLAEQQEVTKRRRQRAADRKVYRKSKAKQKAQRVARKAGRC